MKISHQMTSTNPRVYSPDKTQYARIVETEELIRNDDGEVCGCASSVVVAIINASTSRVETICGDAVERIIEWNQPGEIRCIALGEERVFQILPRDLDDIEIMWSI